MPNTRYPAAAPAMQISSTAAFHPVTKLTSDWRGRVNQVEQCQHQCQVAVLAHDIGRDGKQNAHADDVQDHGHKDQAEGDPITL